MESNKLFVGNISWNLDWKQLKDIFGEYVDGREIRVDFATEKPRD